MNKKRLIELFVVFSLFGFVSGAIVSSTGCKALTPEVKQDILQKKDVACALENAFLSDERIAVICGIADQFLRPILDLVSAQRLALAKSHAVGVTEGRASGATGASSKACPTETSSVQTPSGSKDAGTQPDAAKDAK